MTVPVGKAPLSAARVSVNVMLLPKPGVALDVVRASLGTFAFATVSVILLETAALKFASPAKLAVIASAPTGSALVLRVATPVALSVPVPIAVVPL